MLGTILRIDGTDPAVRVESHVRTWLEGPAGLADLGPVPEVLSQRSARRDYHDPVGPQSDQPLRDEEAH